jgi:hypothetical protein
MCGSKQFFIEKNKKLIIRQDPKLPFFAGKTEEGGTEGRGVGGGGGHYKNDMGMPGRLADELGCGFRTNGRH